MKKQGFTLIELSIVLIIISLIVAGITGGKALISQAELQSITSETRSYVMAINTFKLRYNSLPGDMDNAWDYWGNPLDPGNPGGPGNCKDATVPFPGFGGDVDGCNGNGDDKISFWDTEALRAWQHLTLAELIPGNYTGKLDGTYMRAGINIPHAKKDGVGVWLYTPPTMYEAVEPNTMRVGTLCALGCAMLPPYAYDKSGFSPSDARSLDKKTDDGVASTGNIMTQSGAGGPASPCVNNAGSPIDYILGNDVVNCLVHYVF